MASASIPAGSGPAELPAETSSDQHDIQSDPAANGSEIKLEENTHQSGDISAVSPKHTRGSASSAVSYSSTLEYGHESYETYKVRVHKLCRRLWPAEDNQLIHRIKNLLNRLLHARKLPDPSPGRDYILERMGGGGYNRVIGIKVMGKDETGTKDLVLRVPRFKGAHPDRDVAILNYVRRNTSIPVADIVFSDFTSKNPLESPYVIQQRIAGMDLQNSERIYPELNFKQKRTFATEFGRVVREILSMQSTAPGRLQAHRKHGLMKETSIRHFQLKPMFASDDKFDELSYSTKTPAYKSELDFLECSFERWNSMAGKDPLGTSYMDSLIIVAYQMYKAGYIQDNEYCLCHLDLATAPRNIMVDIREDDSLHISGILDWDEAVFAPKFVACAPPMWLWAWNFEEDEDERLANDTPSTTENQDLKRLFEEAAGPEYLRYAYQPAYRLLRKMFGYAMRGINATWIAREADELIDEWATMRPDSESEILGPHFCDLEEGDSALGVQKDVPASEISEKVTTAV